MSIFLISAILFLCIITVLSIYCESPRRFLFTDFLKAAAYSYSQGRSKIVLIGKTIFVTITPVKQLV